ncbi:MAG: class I SAM-dependent methyltransferase [Cyanobacteria bacterium P01_E01_bin.35]
MTKVAEHYDLVLADVYSWMFGGFASGIEKNRQFFKQHQISSTGSGIAVDLGAGCGFQSIPLAEIGFSVMAIDLNQKLLQELKKNSGHAEIQIIKDDLMNFDRQISNQPELVVCMTDTILHLESIDKVTSLFEKVLNSLENKGKFITTFRDLSCELTELNRFLPVKSDAETIFTCFLEYEPDTVKVHDLVYRWKNDSWQLHKSFYRKLRLSQKWVEEQLQNSGFQQINSQYDRGMVTIIATK